MRGIRGASDGPLMALWWPSDGTLVSQTPSGENDGIVSETWRAAAPRADHAQQFARLRVDH